MKEGLTMSAKEVRRTVVLNAVLEHGMTRGQAAVALGLSERQLWRLLAAYREEGAAGLVHGNRGRVSARATPPAVREQLVQLASGPYDGGNYALIADLVRERDGLQLSRWTVRRILRAAGVGSSRHHRRRSRHRSRRERYAQEGMLLQVDGSRHDWLEGRGPWLTLVGGVDDATGTVPYAVFREQEDAHGYLLLLQGVIREKGIPWMLYSDRHSIFVNSQPHESLEEQLLGRRELTQVGRALQELGIQWIAANSPQAKGRIERLWQTFQERLLMELRLAGATTREEANQVLRAFLPKFNAQFGVPAQQPGSAYRPLPQEMDLAGVLCMKYRRRVASDNTVAFAGKALQIEATAERASYARAWVEVQERLDGSLVVCHQAEILATHPAPEGTVTLRARTGRRAAVPVGSSATVGERVSPGPPVPSGAQGRGRAGRGPLTEARPFPGAESPPTPGPHHPWRTASRAVLTKSLHPNH
jgi:transposase